MSGTCSVKYRRRLGVAGLRWSSGWIIPSSTVPDLDAGIAGKEAAVFDAALQGDLAEGLLPEAEVELVNETISNRDPGASLK